MLPMPSRKEAFGGMLCLFEEHWPCRRFPQVWRVNAPKPGVLSACASSMHGCRGILCGTIVAGGHTPPALRATPSILEGELLP